MKRDLRIILRFLKLSWMREMEYRVNFAIWMAVDIGWILMDLIFFSTLIANTQLIGNWSRGEMFVVIGIFRIYVPFVWGWLFASFNLIPKQISEGKLDFLIMKPVDSQLLISVQKFAFSVLPSFAGGTLFVVTGLAETGARVGEREVIIFSLMFAVVLALIYALYFLTITTAFYFDRLGNIAHLFASFFDAARFPKEIYGIFFQRLFTIVIPIALMLAVPAQVLWGQFELGWMAWLIVATGIFLFLGRKMWISGLRRYTSAA